MIRVSVRVFLPGYLLEIKIYWRKWKRAGWGRKRIRTVILDNPVENSRTYMPPQSYLIFWENIPQLQSVIHVNCPGKTISLRKVDLYIWDQCWHADDSSQCLFEDRSEQCISISILANTPSHLHTHHSFLSFHYIEEISSPRLISFSSTLHFQVSLSSPFMWALS